MKSFLLGSAFLFLIVLTGCDSNPLEAPLAEAVAEERLSSKKSAEILEEYSQLDDEDPEKAAQFAKQISTLIQVGGDSSHIDALRKKYIKTGSEKH